MNMKYFFILALAATISAEEPETIPALTIGTNEYRNVRLVAARTNEFILRTDRGFIKVLPEDAPEPYGSEWMLEAIESLPEPEKPVKGKARHSQPPPISIQEWHNRKVSMFKAQTQKEQKRLNDLKEIHRLRFLRKEDTSSIRSAIKSQQSRVEQAEQAQHAAEEAQLKYKIATGK